MPRTSSRVGCCAGGGGSRFNACVTLPIVVYALTIGSSFPKRTCKPSSSPKARAPASLFALSHQPSRTAWRARLAAAKLSSRTARRSARSANCRSWRSCVASRSRSLVQRALLPTVRRVSRDQRDHERSDERKDRTGLPRRGGHSNCRRADDDRSSAYGGVFSAHHGVTVLAPLDTNSSAGRRPSFARGQRVRRLGRCRRVSSA